MMRILPATPRLWMRAVLLLALVAAGPLVAGGGAPLRAAAEPAHADGGVAPEGTIGPTLRPPPQTPHPGTGVEDGPGSSGGSWESDERSEETLRSGRPNRSPSAGGSLISPDGSRDVRSPVGSALAATPAGTRARSGRAASPATGPPIPPV